MLSPNKKAFLINSLFIFIGDGEDRLKVENYIENKDLSKN